MHSTVILLMNLGSPDHPDTKSLKPYLTEFLMDERVIDVPFWLRSILVKGLIVPFRSSKSAAKYRSIWTNEGSPLVIHTRNQAALLQDEIQLPVYYSMRYGSPATTDILKNIHADHPLVNRIIVLPLYPHYAMSSYETAVEQVKQLHITAGYKSSLQIIPPFYNDDLYITALSDSIRPYLYKEFDHLLFSYHGIPQRHVQKTDCTGTHCLQTTNCCDIESVAHAYCYRHQIISSTNLVAKRLSLTSHQYSFSFQSRLGRDAWLKPYTAGLLKELPSKGIKRLLIVCPAFVSDCLETLEEIAEEGRDEFLKAGGKTFTMVPALNENKAWIRCMANLVEKC